MFGISTASIVLPKTAPCKRGKMRERKRGREHGIFACWKIGKPSCWCVRGSGFSEIHMSTCRSFPCRYSRYNWSLNKLFEARRVFKTWTVHSESTGTPVTREWIRTQTNCGSAVELLSPTQYKCLYMMEKSTKRDRGTHMFLSISPRPCSSKPGRTKVP